MAYRYWISWHQFTSDYRPLQDPPRPENIKAWWCSGATDASSILCAIVDAESEEMAKKAIQMGWDDGIQDEEVGEFRFCEQKESDWLPNDRFPITKNWMKERLGI